MSFFFAGLNNRGPVRDSRAGAPLRVLMPSSVRRSVVPSVQNQAVSWLAFLSIGGFLLDKFHLTTCLLFSKEIPIFVLFSGPSPTSAHC